jgi:hypothetical protein
MDGARMDGMSAVDQGSQPMRRPATTGTISNAR